LKLFRSFAVSVVVASLGLVLLASGALAKTSTTEVRRGLEGLVASPGGPPGAIATLYRNGKLTTISTGRADVRRAGAPRATDHMRIASIAKAFSGAVALNLVRAGKLKLSQTLGELLPSSPSAWGRVTVGEMLNHTSGIPDYTISKPFKKHAETDPKGYVAPTEIVGWVKNDPLEFAPGKKYEYSNTDNILVGLVAESITAEKYGDLLKQIVFGPAGLSQTSFPTNPPLPNPFIHGYMPATPDAAPVDVSTVLSPSGAWASGAIVSTPTDLNAFIRADLGLKFFDRAQQQEQMTFWPGGESSPPGPGKNSAGLALFRYQTRCGTVYGHTGNFPGYVQFAAATADGSRAVTTSLNIPAPSGKLLAQLRRVQTTAVCALLGK
jgi:D-alanyl-D-alanine carboxypeptidase